MGRPNPIQTIVRNWKKTMFIVPAFAFGLYYTVDYTNTLSLMKTSCKHVSRLGDERLRNFNGEMRHITVILNPIAGKRKAKKLYSKWVEPLLHLSGIRVSLIETDSPNQAADLMKVMSNCDGVAIVGGDGTVHEVVNGLISRQDCTRAAQQFPLAIIPVGQFNSIARMIYSDLRYRNYKEFLILSTLNLIESKTQKFDVLKIDSIESDTSNNIDQNSTISQQQSIYALRDVRYGKYQDNYYKTSGYMIYQEYIKPYWLKLRRTFGGPYSKPQIESLSYTKPCIGCTKCYDKHKFKDPQIDVSSASEKETSPSNNNNSRWWTGLIRLSKPATPVAKSSDELEELAWTKNVNPNCDTWSSVEDVSQISEFRACLMNEKKIRLSLARDGEYQPSDVIEVQDVKLKLDPELDKRFYEKNVDQETDNADDDQKKDPQKPKEDKKDKFFIDRQPIDAHSIEITTLSKAVRIFTQSKC